MAVQQMERELRSIWLVSGEMIEKSSVPKLIFDNLILKQRCRLCSHSC
jgi:hypothetical protein